MFLFTNKFSHIAEEECLITSLSIRFSWSFLFEGTVNGSFFAFSKPLINITRCHLLCVRAPPFLLFPVFILSCLFRVGGGGGFGRVRKQSELAGGTPEGTGVWLRCWEMSAHFHVHLRFGTFAFCCASSDETEN